MAQEVKPALAILPQAEKNVGKSLAGGMEGPEQGEPWLGGPARSNRGCWCHPASVQGTTPTRAGRQGETPSFHPHWKCRQTGTAISSRGREKALWGFGSSDSHSGRLEGLLC